MTQQTKRFLYFALSAAIIGTLIGIKWYWGAGCYVGGFAVGLLNSRRKGK